ncbi:MAG: pyrroline-5-carboxylate reductase, partial [Sulfurovum sp.]|nr:pyrroline-5-carboxylate reductase [Sulfurovum sp.]
MIEENTQTNMKIGFIGCGNMTSAIVRGLVKSGTTASHIMASNRSIEKLKEIKRQTGILTNKNNHLCAEFSDLLILSVKPQVLLKVCDDLSNIDLSNKVIVSVAAGITTAKISQSLSQDLPIVRAMPNTPALISKGATGLFANEQTTDEQKQQVQLIFDSVGYTNWVKQEPLIDVVTAIAGSAPAYLYMLMEAMTDQAVSDGLDYSSARKLVTQAVIGSGKLAEANEQTSLLKLRQNVT